MPQRQLWKRALCLVTYFSLSFPDFSFLSDDHQSYKVLCNFTGGGVALLYASKELDKLQTANFDQKIGVQIIQNALKVCFVILKRGKI